MATKTRYPSSDYSVNGWTNYGATSVWDCVNDTAGAPDDNTTYVTAGAINLVALLGFSAFDVPTGAVINKLSIVVRGYIYGITVFKGAIRVNGITYYTSDYTEAGFTTHTYDWTTNPKTGSAWTVNDINSVAGGNPLQYMGFCGSFEDKAHSVSYTQAYLVVDYTEAVVPTVTGQATTNITATTATAHATVTSDGGSTVSSVTFTWNTRGYWVNGDPGCNANETPGVGTFTGSLTNLSPSTHYYVQACVTNSVGQAWTSWAEFNTLPGPSGGRAGKFAVASNWGWST